MPDSTKAIAAGLVVGTGVAVGVAVGAAEGVAVAVGSVEELGLGLGSRLLGSHPVKAIMQHDMTTSVVRRPRYFFMFPP
jgi:hypothetical protein